MRGPLIFRSWEHVTPKGCGQLCLGSWLAATVTACAKSTCGLRLKAPPPPISANAPAASWQCLTSPRLCFFISVRSKGSAPWHLKTYTVLVLLCMCSHIIRQARVARSSAFIVPPAVLAAMTGIHRHVFFSFRPRLSACVFYYQETTRKLHLAVI